MGALGVDVTLAGAVTMVRGDRHLSDAAFPGRQLRLVTAMLVLGRQDPVSMERLADELWPENVPDQWRPAVRLLVSKVRRAAADLGLPAESITSIGGAYRVDLGQVHVDIERAAGWTARARAELAEGNIESGRDLANRARAVLSRPILPGVESEWLDEIRDRATRDGVDALILLGECRSLLGHHPEARAVLAQAVERAPLREDAWRALMQVELRAGNAGAALQAYERARYELVEGLGVDPSPDTQRLHLEILESIPSHRTCAWPPRAAPIARRWTAARMSGYVPFMAATRRSSSAA
jgi:DNA-binding SARP family transcriptional activator